MHSQKGLAPIIAAVLLVVAAIIIGTLAVTWASGWVSQRTTTAASDCSFGTSFFVKDVRYFNQISANDTGSLSGKLTNTGTTTVGNISVELELTNGTIARVFASSPTQATNITAGETVPFNFTYNITSSSSIISARFVANTCKGYSVTVKNVK